MVSAISHHMSLLLWVRRVALAVISIVLFGGISDFDRSLFAKQQGMIPGSQGDEFVGLTGRNLWRLLENSLMPA